MTHTYTGAISGFQAITTLGAPISLHSELANDLNAILDNLAKIYDTDKMRILRNKFANHTTNLHNPHNIELLLLSHDILVEVYNVWLELGNYDTFDVFVTRLFTGAAIADESMLSGDSLVRSLTVVNFFKVIHKYHMGPIYAHPPVLDQMFIGEPVLDLPLLYFIDLPIAYTKVFQVADTGSITYATAADYILSNIVDTSAILGTQVVGIDFTNKLINSKYETTISNAHILKILTTQILNDLKLGRNEHDMAIMTLGPVISKEEASLISDNTISYSDAIDYVMESIVPTNDFHNNDRILVDIDNRIAGSGYMEIKSAADMLAAFMVQVYPDVKSRHDDDDLVYIKLSELPPKPITLPEGDATISFEKGTFYLKVPVTYTETTKYYFRLYDTPTTSWMGYPYLPTTNDYWRYEPVICIFRHKDDPANIYIRFSRYGKVTQLVLPVTVDFNSIVVTYDATTISWGYCHPTQGNIISSIPRVLFPIAGQRFTVEHTSEFRYYIDTVSQPQIAFLLT